jgi:hypothetical protein
VHPVFYLVAILFVVASPLIVPVTVTIVHAVRNRRQSAAAGRPNMAGAIRPSLNPAHTSPVPAAA